MGRYPRDFLLLCGGHRLIGMVKKVLLRPHPYSRATAGPSFLSVWQRLRIWTTRIQSCSDVCHSYPAPIHSSYPSVRCIYSVVFRHFCKGFWDLHILSSTLCSPFFPVFLSSLGCLFPAYCGGLVKIRLRDKDLELTRSAGGWSS